MSEKRFYLGNNDTTICDRSQGGSDGFNMLTIFKVVDLLNEQQATISRLKKENGQLREINKDIGDDLYNCRINKNIIREKLKLWQDVHKKYNIYSIKDFEELMKNDK